VGSGKPIVGSGGTGRMSHSGGDCASSVAAHARAQAHTHAIDAHREDIGCTLLSPV
jgi:hypothetical protein